LLKNLFFLFGILFVTVTYFWFRGEEEPFSPLFSRNENPTVESNSGIPLERSRRTLEAPRRPLLVNDSALNPACQKYWESVRSLDLGEFEKVPPTIRELPNSSECKSPPREFELVHRQVEEACSGIDFSTKVDASNASAWLTKLQPCYDNLVLYRAQMTEWLTRDTPLSEITDPDILDDKLLSRIAVDAASSVDVARRLVQLQPENYLVRKALVWGELNRAAKNARGAEDWRAVEEALQAVRDRGELAANDRQFAEMEGVVLAKKNGDPRDILPFAERMNREHPDWGVGPYQLAFVASKEGNSEDAIKWTREAIRREPGNPTYKNTLGRLLAGFTAQKQGVFESSMFIPLKEF